MHAPVNHERPRECQGAERFCVPLDDYTFNVLSDDLGDGVGLPEFETSYRSIITKVAECGIRVIGERVFAASDITGQVLGARGALYHERGLALPPIRIVNGTACQPGTVTGILLTGISGAQPAVTIEYFGTSGFQEPQCALLTTPASRELYMTCVPGVRAGAEGPSVCTIVAHHLGRFGFRLEDVAQLGISAASNAETADTFRQLRTEITNALSRVGRTEPKILPVLGETREDIGPLGGSLAIDLLAIQGGTQTRVRHLRSDFEGRSDPLSSPTQSDFARAALVERPDHWTMLVAGVTSLNADGYLIFRGNAEGQIRKAFSNLRALLVAQGFTWADVCHLVLVCRDSDSYRSLQSLRSELAFDGVPHAYLLSAMPRGEVLFAIDAVAIRARPTVLPKASMTSSQAST